MSDSPSYRTAVFGATSAIAGETLRALLADRPAEILLIGRNADRLETVAADLRARGAVCEVHATDLLNPDAGWESLLAGKEWDLFLIAHGSLPDQDATLADPHATGREIDINLISPVRIAAACARILDKQQKGTLAVFGSVAGDRGRQSNYLYGATKAALETFLAGLRHRFADLPAVAITLLKPGLTDTPMTANIEKGPLFSSASKVGEAAWKAIHKRKSTAYLPGWWRLVMGVIRHLPEFVLHKTKL
ncbi:SDR family NAD(P)-dependent oxidoreductase [Haloferula sp. A504]|uniref:SDR family NAD(P)-dependent oxidoreductase n=1 Tax=Haloferula sp. A504 TaxID=3373601 RepID=UPI0031C58E04|nr:SDR family NAD(P)-dependent oxidoreductase [Verrucomicrobiaceae bacterium E54]